MSEEILYNEVQPSGAPLQFSNEIDKLMPALVKAQAAIKPVAKDKTARAGSYSYDYADLAAVLAAIKEVLHKNELCVIQAPSSENDSVSVTTVIAHGSGQWVQSRLSCTWTDSKPQSLGSLITYLRRYSLSAMLNVATEEDDDGQSAQERAGTQPKQDAAPSVISERQRKLLYAKTQERAKEIGLDDWKRIGQELVTILGVSSTTEIKKADFDKCLSFVEKYGNNSESEPDGLPEEAPF